MTQADFEAGPDGTLIGAWKTPVNIAADAAGSIHNDETAKKLGLEGGWIAGSIHMEQFAPLLLERFGAYWLKAGTMSVHFRNATLSGQPVRAFLGPVDPATRFAGLRMEDEAGRIVCEGVAFTGEPSAVSPIRQRLATNHGAASGALLSAVEVGRNVKGIPSMIPESRLAKDLPGNTAPIEAYASGTLPANLAIDALRAVEPHLVELQSGCVGLYGSIELQVFDGPIEAGVDYTCNGEVLCVGQTPRTETLWYSSELLREGRPVARLLMMSRIMQLD
jgi:hypothetical protein